MRNIVIVAMACFLTAAVFWIGRSTARGAAEPLDALSAGVDRIALRWASEGPALESRIITIVLSAAYDGSDPMTPRDPSQSLWQKIFSGQGSGGFLEAMGREPDTLTWSLGRIHPDEAQEYLEPFARILVKAYKSGGRVRVIARGHSAVFAARAALAAADTVPAGGLPILDRLTGVGIHSKLLAERHRTLFSDAARKSAVGEWLNIWSDKNAVARSVYAEHWRPGFAEPKYVVRAWNMSAWPVVVIRVSTFGMEGLPRERIVSQVAAPAPRKPLVPGVAKEDRRGSLDMVSDGLKKKEKRISAEDMALSETFPIGDSGWITKKLKNFEYIQGHELTAFWTKAPFRIDILYHTDQAAWVGHEARGRCKKAGLKVVAVKLHGFPAEVCNQVYGKETSRVDAHHDYFTIRGKGYRITVVYTYDPRGARDMHMKKYMAAIEALKPA